MDWVKIATEGPSFKCPVGVWLDRGVNFNSSVTSSCQKIKGRKRRYAEVSTICCLFRNVLFWSFQTGINIIDSDAGKVKIEDGHWTLKVGCTVNEFKCLDGTCIPWEKLCDDVQDCPKSEQGPGGEDEDFWPEGSGEESEGG